MGFGISLTLSDVSIGSFLYWSFLERTIQRYSTSSENERKQILPHLVRELGTFDLYAGTDANDSDICNQEFWVNRLILYPLCRDLAEIYRIECPPPTLIFDPSFQAQESTWKEKVLSKHERLPIRIKETITDEEDKRAARKERFFMTQLITYRVSKQPLLLFLDSEDGIIQAARTYVLPLDGPRDISISELSRPVQANDSHPPKQHKPKKEQQSQPKQTAKQKRRAKALMHATSAFNDVDENPPSTAPNEGEKLESVRPSYATVVSSTSPVCIATTTQHPIQPSFVFKATYLDHKLVTVQRSPSFRYSYHGTVYDDTSLFDPKSHAFHKEFLTNVKYQLRRATDKTGVFPNIAAGLIKIFYTAAGQEHNNFALLDPLFVSGGKIFEDTAFQKQHNLMTIETNMLTTREKRMVALLPYSEERTFLIKTFMERRLQEVVKGSWKGRTLDSENLLVLHIREQLPLLLGKIFGETSAENITVNAVILEILSTYECCHTCQYLLQSFQHHALQGLIRQASPRINFRDDFATLVLTGGFMALKPKKTHNSPFPYVQVDMPTLDPSSHKFIASTEFLKKELPQ